jgi:hypothetical protein
MVEYMADDSKTEDTLPEPESLVPPTPNLGLEDPEAVQKRKEVREFVIGLLVGIFVVIPVACGCIVLLAMWIGGPGGLLGTIAALGIYIGTANYTINRGHLHAGKGIFLALPVYFAVLLLVVSGTCFFSPWKY